MIPRQGAHYAARSCSIRTSQLSSHFQQRRLVARASTDRGSRTGKPSKYTQPWSLPAWSNEFKRKVNPLNLAMLGDAAWALYMRNKHFCPPKNSATFQQAVKREVTAEAQAVYYDRLVAQGQLQQAELEMLEWAAHSSDIKLRARFGSPSKEQQYRKSTGLEALVGYLYLTDTSRLDAVMELLVCAADEQH